MIFVLLFMYKTFITKSSVYERESKHVCKIYWEYTKIVMLYGRKRYLPDHFPDTLEYDCPHPLPEYGDGENCRPLPLACLRLVETGLNTQSQSSWLGVSLGNAVTYRYKPCSVCSVMVCP